MKFQKRNNKRLFTSEAYNEPYNSENAFGSTYGSHREFLEFGLEQYTECINESKKLGITFFNLNNHPFYSCYNNKNTKFEYLRSMATFINIASTKITGMGRC